MLRAIPIVTPIHDSTTRERYTYLSPMCIKSIGQRKFAYLALKIFNIILDHLKNISDIKNIGKQLKVWLKRGNTQIVYISVNNDSTSTSMRNKKIGKKCSSRLEGKKCTKTMIIPDGDKKKNSNATKKAIPDDDLNNCPSSTWTFMFYFHSTSHLMEHHHEIYSLWSHKQTVV